ncbi:MAG: hypothetical protein CFH35_00457 [Alphaproteobacteria bacterium MarineAlpha9_Bin5]|nr:MAG: hypothetical protein CFH36_00189 [Alphaproteobacteria bacterium MarineAlpha9_Bin6]PPR39590.1 MAG: hypothetical protein CFH35_00457 [Alphaproteobacteria bacterium MarineAlpha9_Bin5]
MMNPDSRVFVFFLLNLVQGTLSVGEVRIGPISLPLFAAFLHSPCVGHVVVSNILSNDPSLNTAL